MNFINHFLKYTFIMFFTAVSFTVTAKNLECKNLYAIQSKYLDSHINFSSLKKSNEKALKRKISVLEARTRDQFIKFLDSEKLYLTSFDVSRVKKQFKNIFKKVQKNSCSGLDKVYDIYYKRVAERAHFANKYLKTFKLDKKIKINLDSKKRSRFKNLRQVNHFHKKYLQYKMAEATAASDKDSESEKLAEAKANILRSYDNLKKQVKSWSVHLSPREKKKCHKNKSLVAVEICKPYKWYSIYLNSFARAFDPHSGYMSQEDQEDFEINMKLSLEGIGASLSSRFGHTVIERLVPGGAASRSGKLKPKDKILAVGQRSGKMVPIFNMNLRDVVSLIRGKKGTPVFLKILRTVKKQDRKKIFTVKIIRDRVNLEDQAADIFYFDRKSGAEKTTVAVIHVPSFYSSGQFGGRSVTADVKKLIKKAKQKKASAIVLDMAGNGGGALGEAVELAGLFFSKGSVVRQLVKNKAGDQYRTFSDIDIETHYTGPLITLINRISASASEIVSGTLKSYKRAVVVGGDHTFGKGSIQSVESLDYGLGSIRVTVGLFFIPNGFSTQLIGVSSDIPFPSVFSNDEIGEKNLDYVLPEKRIPSFLSQNIYSALNGKRWSPVTQDMISFLKKQSSKRIEKNKKFKEINKLIAEMQDQKNKGYITSIEDIIDKIKKIKEDKDKTDDKDKEEADEEIETAQSLRKKYRERPDIQESVNIAFDQIEWEKKHKLIANKNLSQKSFPYLKAPLSREDKK